MGEAQKNRARTRKASHQSDPGASASAATLATRDAIAELAPWFHNLHLPDGTQTAPDHWLGDFPTCMWKHIAGHIPTDLSGWSVLDIGCNAGFYSFELARRGAAVTAVDLDPHYLQQAQWAAEQFGISGIRFRQMQVYDLALDNETYDLVWFMGVLYHLRYPMLGLDIVCRKVRRLLMFQTMSLPGEHSLVPPEDVALDDRHLLLQPGWPSMAFIEHRLAGDPSNWWAPNHACVEAMLRTCKMQVVTRLGHEVYLCQPEPGAARDDDALWRAEYRAATGRPHE